MTNDGRSSEENLKRRKFVKLVNAEERLEMNKFVRSSVRAFKVPDHISLARRKSKSASSIIGTKVLQYIFIFYPGELTN